MTRITVRLDTDVVVMDAVRRAIAAWRQRVDRDDSDETLAALVRDQLGRVIHWDEGPDGRL